MSVRSVGRSFQDAELDLYLAGQAKAPLREAIEAAVEADETLARRLAAADPWAPVLRSAFDGVARAAPIDRLAASYGEALAHHRVQSALAAGGSTQNTVLWLRARAMALGIGLGVTIGGALWFLSGGPIATDVNPSSVSADPPPAPLNEALPPPPAIDDLPLPPLPAPPEPPAIAAPTLSPWLVAVADYVRLFGAETLSTGRPSQAQLQRSLRIVGERINLDLARMVAVLPGLQLRRVDLLRLNGQPLAQLIFADAAGRPVALCILARPLRPPGAPEAPSPIAQNRLHGLSLAHWDRDRHGFLVIGGQAPESVVALAAQIRRR